LKALQLLELECGFRSWIALTARFAQSAQDAEDLLVGDVLLSKRQK
jgi:hypothetical protein